MTQEEVYSNSVKCQELALEKDANNTELEELYEKWEELAEYSASPFHFIF